MTTINFLQFRGNISNRLNNLKWLQASVNKLVVIGLLYSLLGTSTALAMSPAPSPVIPKFDPIPGTPNLFIDLHQTDIALRWNATEYAEFYTVHVYSGGQWQEVEDIYSTEATYNYERSSWDLSALQFKITACKVKPSWLSLFWWEGDRCSVDSNIVQLLQFNPVFSLSSYPVSLNTLSASPADSLDSQMLPADTVNAVRTIMATLRLRDTISWSTQDIPWPIELDEENFTVTSGKTILVKLGNYHIELLATQGDAQYVARALNVALNGTQSSIPLQLKTVLGDGAVTIDTLNDLSAFNFQSNSEQLTDLSQPAIGVKIDGHYETLLTFNPQMGITPQYHLISSGRHQIQLKVHDANLLKGRSRPQQEDRVIFAGQNLAMDLIPLVGGITTTLVDGTATLNLMIPSVVVDEVGGDPNNLQVMLSLSGINNQPEDVIVDNLIYNATADAYEAQYTYSDLQADAQVAISLTFSDTSGLVNKLLGRCVANDLTLDSATRNVPCQMTVRRRAIGGNHPLAELGINVLDAGNAPVRGASVYAKRQGSQNNAGVEDLGTLLGVTGSGAFGTAGYLETHLVPGSYQLTAKYAPVDGTAQQTISLSAFEKTYQDLILDTIVTPNITVTAPESDVIVDASYTISWTASDLDDQASISLYKDSDQTGHDGQLIVDGLIEGTHTSYNWNTSLEPSGNYYIYAKIDDGANPPVYDYGAGRITINRPPAIAITAPAVDTVATDGYTISWTATDSDNQASISLYYDNNASGNNGTLITSSLSEGIHSSYTWNTSSLSSGDYYIYAKIDDGVNPPVYDYGAGRITVNRPPNIAITAPAANTTVDGSYIIAWTASDPDNQASISLYYDNNASGINGTLITNSLSEGIHSSYTWNTSSLSSGDYYIYAKIDDGVNPPVYDYGAGRITVNRPPNIAITAPAANTTVDGSYIIAWTASDPDNQASISLYYDNNASGINGTLITNSLSEGIHSSYTWNTSSLSSGDYYIYAKIDDGVNPSVYDYGAGRITVNRAPSIILTAPATNMTASAHHKITWVANDADNQANISLYYDNNNSGYDGTLITNSLSEGIHNSYTWNTSSLSSGDYHIYAKIDDGVNSPVYHYANGKVTVVAVKLNDTGITWGGDYPSGNNTDCTGETIAQQDCSHGRDAQAVAGTLTKVGGGNAGFDFTKLDINGNALSASATNHRCVRDNHTGLIWEVKTDDGGIHDKDNTYRWGGKTALVTQQARDNGWGDFYDDWDTLVDGSNNESLCGFSDWRVPTLMELLSIVDMGRINPSIDSNYFPNAVSSWYWSYWSSSPIAGINAYAWVVYFPFGSNFVSERNFGNAVRLVRGGQ